MINSPILNACPELCILLGHVRDKTKIVLFERPMSKKARQLLFDMAKATTSFSTLKPSDAVQTLIHTFDPIRFEEAVHKYDMSKIVKLIPKKIKKLEDYEYYVTLTFVDDQEWLEKHDVEPNRNKVGMLTGNGQAVELYRWAVSSFLLTDFTEADLNKLAHMGSGIYDVNTVMSEGAKIKDADKRSVSYLYAIVRDSAIRHHSVKQKEAEAHQAGVAKLATMASQALNVGPTVAFEPTDREDLAKLRALAEAARSIKV